MVERTQLFDKEFITFALSLELKNNCEVYPCICPSLLVFLLMNIPSEFLILHFHSHWDNFEEFCVFEKSQHAGKVFKCENHFTGRKASKH